MKSKYCLNKYTAIFLAIALLSLAVPGSVSAQSGSFPMNNAWVRFTPSVVWCGDPRSVTTIEAHIIGRNDVARVWITNLNTSDTDARGELFDDGTHGDVTAGDNVFTLYDVVLCPESFDFIAKFGYSFWMGNLEVQLKNGSEAKQDSLLTVGLVDVQYKDAFQVEDFGNGLSATQFAFFIVDDQHQVMDGYPVSNITASTTHAAGLKKLYSVLPDAFDFAVVMPGMQLYRTGDLGERTPYEIGVKNDVQHIGLSIFDNTAVYGSAGRLRSVVYHSFGGVDIVDHEMGHAWGMSIGNSLGLVDPQTKAHWNKFSDIHGQDCLAYFDDSGNYGCFQDNGDGTWKLVADSPEKLYSPLELYVMGLIPPEEVPPVHILDTPNLTDPNRITAASVRTITIEQIMQAEGGPRLPSAAESQKDFTLAFIVTQDIPFNDAAYAYFSLLSHELMTKEPHKGSYLSPFAWATGGRGTLDSRLPLSLAAPSWLPGDPAPTEAPTCGASWGWCCRIPSSLPTR